MNTHPGILGKKIGTTQIFDEKGEVIRCTVVQCGAVVVGKRTKEKNGYDALVVGLGERKAKHTTKPVAGAFKKAEQAPRRVVRELRGAADWVAKFEVGQTLPLADIFQVGQFVDAQGTTRGRGFTGVMRRWNFAGNVDSHGTHEYRRHGGSIGTNMTPGRTKLGMRMPGQMGNVRVSVLNQKVAKVIADQHLVLVYGGVPGSKGTLVELRGAIKRRGGRVAPAK